MPGSGLHRSVTIFQKRSNANRFLTQFFHLNVHFMKLNLLILIFICARGSVSAQDLHPGYLRLMPASERGAGKRIELSSDIDTTWGRWKERGYNFGFNPAVTPMYTTVNGILSTPYMLQVRGNEHERKYKRWGYHVFEGYAKDDKSRITMLLNKHIEEGFPVAELYYYSTVYDHSASAYNWFRIGSDVKHHSFMFGRDKAIFYGSLRMSNAFTLGNIGTADLARQQPDGDAEANAEQDAKFVNFKELKGSGNGTMFYDKDNNIVVIKVGDKWMKVVVEELPANIKYSF